MRPGKIFRKLSWERRRSGLRQVSSQVNDEQGRRPDERVVSDALGWLSSVRNPGGGYAAASLSAHYKSPLLFAQCNLSATGNEILEWTVDNYMTSAGHFQETGGTTSAVRRYCDLYEDLWLAWGASRLQQARVANEIFDFCLKFLDDKHGGFRSLIQDAGLGEPTPYDLRSTALAGIAALAAGKEQVAREAGRFTIALLEMQPENASEFFLVRDASGKLITSYPPDVARFFSVPERPIPGETPLYYALGLGMTFLAKLYELTGDSTHLAGAERYAAQCRKRGEDILRNHYSGKLGWGFKLLQRLTGRTEYGELSAIAVGYLLRTQMPSGAWHVPTLYPDFLDQPLSFTIDRTAEYALWIQYVNSEDSALRSRASRTPTTPSL
jgi:hypothetical protein